MSALAAGPASVDAQLSALTTDQSRPLAARRRAFHLLEWRARLGSAQADAILAHLQGGDAQVDLWRADRAARLAAGDAMLQRTLAQPAQPAQKKEPTRANSAPAGPGHERLRDPDLERLLLRLHAMNDAQADDMARSEAERSRSAGASAVGAAVSRTVFYSDKMVALDLRQGGVLLQLCAASVRRVVEMSLGVRRRHHPRPPRYEDCNAARTDGDGLVIATEHEPAKAARPRQLRPGRPQRLHGDLREGDPRIP